jgi:hypothetical protein
VRLIAIAGIGCGVSQVARLARASEQIQQPLEAQHRLKHLRGVTDARDESALQLSRAHPEPHTQAADAAVRMPSKLIQVARELRSRRVFVIARLELAAVHLSRRTVKWIITLPASTYRS